MPPWPFNDPFAGPAVILLVAGACGWLSDRLDRKPLSTPTAAGGNEQ